MIWAVYADANDSEPLCKIEAPDEKTALNVARDMWGQFSDTLEVEEA